MGGQSAIKLCVNQPKNSCSAPGDYARSNSSDKISTTRNEDAGAVQQWRSEQGCRRRTSGQFQALMAAGASGGGGSQGIRAASVQFLRLPSAWMRSGAGARIG